MPIKLESYFDIMESAIQSTANHGDEIKTQTLGFFEPKEGFSHRSREALEVISHIKSTLDL